MLNVVITGSTRGIGLAYARKFLEYGDSVIISSRNQSRVDEVVNHLSQQYPDRIFGKACDVTGYESVKGLGDFSIDQMGSVDIWINNAGISPQESLIFVDHASEDIAPVIETNITGLLYGVHVAMRIMREQGNGQIINMGGRGTTGEASPESLIYSFSKAGYLQLAKTLKEELKGTGVGIHTLSPGMVITDLLINRELTPRMAKVFNILCVLPSKSATALVPKIRDIKSGDTGKFMTLLTSFKAGLRFMTAWRFKNRYFDEVTLEPLYRSEDLLQ